MQGSQQVTSAATGSGKGKRGRDYEGEDGGEVGVSSRTRKKTKTLVGQGDGDAYEDAELSDEGDDDADESVGRKGRKGKRPQSKKSKGSSGSFKRGGPDVWIHRTVILTTNQIPTEIGDLIAKISMISGQVLDEGGCTTVMEMLTNLVISRGWEEGTSAFQVDSLELIARRCGRAEELSVSSQFISMINMLQFTAKLERPVHYSSHLHI